MENPNIPQLQELLNTAKTISASALVLDLIPQVYTRNPCYFSQINLKAIAASISQEYTYHKLTEYSLQREFGRLTLQEEKRKEAIENGLQPDYIFALSKDDIIDLYPLIQVLKHGGVASVASALDDIVFDYLRLLTLIDNTDASHFGPEERRDITWMVRRLRDALLIGCKSPFLSNRDSGAVLRNESFMI